MKLFLRITLISCLAMPVANCSERPTDIEFLARAKDSFEQGNTQAAVVDLKNALVINPLNNEARLLLGEIYVKLEDGASAQKELEHVAELERSAQAVALLARALLMQNKNQEVLDLRTLDVLDTPNLVDYRVSRAIAHQRLGNLSEAGAELDAAIAVRPDASYALEGLALLSAEEGDLERARSIISEVTNSEAATASTWSLLGSLENGLGNLAAAEQAFTTAIQLRSNKVADLLNRAMVRINQKKYAEAENDLANIDKIMGAQTVATSYARGFMHFAKGEYEQAQIEFEKVLNVNDRYLLALYYSGVANMRLGHEAIAESKLAAYVSRESGYPPANKMLAAIKMQNRDFKEAERLLRAALENTPNDETLLTMLSDSLAAQGRGDEAVVVLRQLVEVQPDSVDAQTALASGLIANDDIQSGIEVLRTAISMDPKAAISYAILANAYKKLNDSDAALQVANDYLAAAGESATAYNLLATVNLYANREAQAVEAFKRALELEPGNTSASNGLAIIAVKNGQPDKAINYYQDALAAHPGDLTTLLNLGDVYLLKKDSKKLRQVLEEAIATYPDALKPRIRLAWLYAKENEPERAMELLVGFKDKYPNNVGLLVLLADASYKMKRFSEAQITLEKLKELSPDNAGLRYSLAKTYRQLGKKAQYLQSLREALELNPDLYQARIELANNLVVSNEIPSAQEQLRILKQRFDRSAEVLLLEAKIAELQEDYVAAVAAYKPIYDYTPNNVNLLRLTGAMWNAGDKVTVLKMLEAWLQEHPQDSAVQLELANRYMLEKRYPDAISLYEEILEKYPDNDLVMNNLAWLLRESDNKRAIRYAEKVYNENQTVPEIMDTFAQVLLVRGDRNDLVRAERLLETALKAQPDNPSFIYHSALVDIEQEDSNSAKEKLSKVLSQDGDFPQRAEAEELFSSLK